MKLIQLNDSTDFFSPTYIEIAGHKVAYVSQTVPSMAHKTPLLILGCAFEGIANFQYELKQISKDVPVYLVDLPGFGTNLSKSHDISYIEYSKILKGFLDGQGIERCSIAALSYCSPIGYCFASLFPERVGRLMIGGVTRKLRDSVRVTLEESLSLLATNATDRFASSIVLNIMNFSHRHKVENSEVLKKALYDSLIALNHDEKEKFNAMNTRFMDHGDLPRAPQCPVLVIGGEFDNFMTPYQCYELAKSCPNSSFVIVKGADHLLGLEKKDVLTRLYRRFISDRPLNRMKDVEAYQGREFPKERMRMEPRWSLNDVGYLDSGNGVFVPISIVDINNSGCKLYTSFKDHPSLKRVKRFLLHLPGEEIQIEITLIKQTDDGHFRGIFQHQSFECSRRLEAFIEKVALNSNSELAV